MLCLTLLHGRVPVAAAVAETDPGPQVFPLATNIQQLGQLAVKEHRALCSFRIEALVCATNAAMDRLLLQDDSGAELIEMDLRGRQLLPGDRVKLEGQRCSVVFLAPGLAIGTRAVVDNDGRHPMLRKSGRVYLEPGRHPLRLLWFNGLGPFG